MFLGILLSDTEKRMRMKNISVEIPTSFTVLISIKYALTVSPKEGIFLGRGTEDTATILLQPPGEGKLVG